MNQNESIPQSSSKLKLILICCIILLLLAAAKYFNATEFFRNALGWIARSGPSGIIFFIAIYILACVLFLPGTILTLGAGAIFGVIKGSLIVSAGSSLGATCAFLVGRTVARGWVEKKIAGSEKFKAIDEAVAKEGWKIVGLSRLSPIFPFNLLNYAYGVTKVSLKDYFFSSWIGMMPGTVLYVYIGSIAGDVASLGGAGQGSQTSALQWAMRIAGLMATILVTIVITRIAKKALEKRGGLK